MVSYEEYLNELKSGNAISPCYKIEILNENDTPKMVITDDILADGSLAGKTNNGQRRTATVTIFNGHKKYKNIFYGTKLALYAGIIVKGEPYYEQLGIFYVHKITSARGTITDNITLTLVDKWGRLDGTIFGKNPARVSFNKSLTVYRNTSVTRKGESGNEINSAAITQADFAEIPQFVTFVNPTQEANNSLSADVNFNNCDFLYNFLKTGISFNAQQKVQSHFCGCMISYKFNTSGNMHSFWISSHNTGSQLWYQVNDVTVELKNYYNEEIIPYGEIIPINSSYDGKYLYLYFNNTLIFQEEINEEGYVILGVTPLIDINLTDMIFPNVSYIINYDYNIYDIIKATLKKSVRYDMRVIAEIPTEIKNFSVDAVNSYLQNCITDLSTIKIGEAVYLTSTGEIYYCSTNDWNPTTCSYNPTWLLQELSYGDILDDVEPILDPYYEPVYVTEDNIEKVVVYNEKYLRADSPYGLLTLPKSIVQEKGETDGKLISGLADLLSAEIGYNRYGQFFLRPSGREIKLEEKEVIWRFKYNDYTVLQQKVSDYSNLINYVVVSGNTTDGVELTEYAGNYDVASDYCVQKIGVIPYIYKLDYSYDPDEWTPTDTIGLTEEEITELQYKAIRKNMQELAEWYLERNKGMQATMSLTCCYIPHIEENKIIELQDAAGEYKKYVIDSFNLPLNYSGTMTITCTKVGE